MKISSYSFGVAALVPYTPYYFLVYPGFLFVAYFEWIVWAVPAFLRAGHMGLAEQCVFWADFVCCRLSSHFPGDAGSLCFNWKFKILICEEKKWFSMIKWNRRVNVGCKTVRPAVLSLWWSSFVTVLFLLKVFCLSDVLLNPQVLLLTNSAYRNYYCL